jgi:hypothetical protein
MSNQEALALTTYLVRAGMLQPVSGQAAVWRDALAGVRYEDAQEAVRALARRPGVVLVKPGDLLFEVHKLRASRIGGRRPPAPPVELSPEADAEFGRVYVRALGDGASEAEADAAACAAAGVVRGVLPAPEPGRLRELLAGMQRTDEPEGV